MITVDDDNATTLEVDNLRGSNLQLTSNITTNKIKINNGQSVVLYTQGASDYCTLRGARNLNGAPTADTGYINFSGYWNTVGMQYHQSNSQASTRLKINGTLQQNTSPHTSSDDRFKHNEVIINNSLGVIRKLTPKKYKKTFVMYEPDYQGEIKDEWVYETGLISQEILKIDELEYCVVKTTGIVQEEDTETKEYYSLKYQDIFVYGLAATKELDKIVQNQQAEINDLKAENNLLKQENILIKSKLNEILTELGKETI